MALSRLFGNVWADPWEAVGVPPLLGNQYFGNVVHDDFFRRPRYQMGETGTSEVVNNDKEFRINLDVKHFKPEELKITTKENRLIISAHHEERPDEHGFIMREFTRQYVLPKDVDPKAVTSALKPNGILTLKAPKLALEAPGETVIPITFENGMAN